MNNLLKDPIALRLAWKKAVAEDETIQGFYEWVETMENEDYDYRTEKMLTEDTL